MTRLELLLRWQSLLRAGYSSFSSSTTRETDLQTGSSNTLGATGSSQYANQILPHTMTSKTITVIGPPKFIQGAVAHYAATFNYVPLKKTIKVSANSVEASFFAPDNVLWSMDGMTMYFTLSSGNAVPHTLYVADCLAPAVSAPFPYTVI